MRLVTCAVGSALLAALSLDGAHAQQPVSARFSDAIVAEKRLDFEAGLTASNALTVSTHIRQGIDRAVAGARFAAAARVSADVGTVTGEVVDARTGAPLASVQVHIPGLSVGTLTSLNGRFALANVPAGTHEVRAERIGYQAVTASVAVSDGATVVANFRLNEQALALNEIVVTGTAGQARRREVGNSITQLRPTDVVEATQSVEALLQGRGLGMTVMQTSGAAGAGSQIRLRGNVSYSLSNEPLIYVDGIRINNEGFRRASNTGSNRSSLADINPNDIERVEIVKGAAATTLYGSEAASGVIQIFTKRGSAGAAAWTAELAQGFAEMRPFGAGDNPYLFLDPWLRKGWRQRYALDVRGGSTETRYFVSGVYENYPGPIQNNSQEKTSLRANFDFNIGADMRLDITTSFTHDDLELLSQGGTGDASFILNAIRGEQGYLATRDVDELTKMLDQRNPQSTDRFISGATLSYAPTENFTHRVTVGHDLAEADLQQVTPYNWLDRPTILGRVRAALWRQRNLTLDYRGSVKTPVFALASTFSWGAQMNRRAEVRVEGTGNDLPGPGDFTVSSASDRQAAESRIRYITGGVFGEMQFAHADRYFLTLGGRLDGSSAFGEELGLEFYPKASLSYVLSEEPFWPETLGSVKLRVAYGHAGRAPGATAATRTWNAPGWGALPAISVGNSGNPDLGPERTVELEVGTDAAFLDDRLSLEFTYYHSRTSDALLPVGKAPSSGGGSSQGNAGKLQNKGIELGLNAQLLERRDWGLGAGLRLTTNHSKMLDMKGAPPFTLPSLGAPLATAWIKEGYPVPVMIAWKLLNPNDKADPVWDQNFVFGPNHPTHIIGGNLDVRLMHGIVVSATGEYQGGHYVEALLVGRALTRSVRPWPYCVDAYEKPPAERLAWERAECFGAPSFHQFTWPADFFKLRDLSLRVPVGFAVPGSGDATFTLSARNYFTWKNKDWKIYDPDMTGSSGTDSSYRVIDEVLPPPAIVTAMLRVRF